MCSLLLCFWKSVVAMCLCISGSPEVPSRAGGAARSPHLPEAASSKPQLKCSGTHITLLLTLKTRPRNPQLPADSPPGAATLSPPRAFLGVLETQPLSHAGGWGDSSTRSRGVGGERGARAQPLAEVPRVVQAHSSEGRRQVKTAWMKPQLWACCHQPRVDSMAPPLGPLSSVPVTVTPGQGPHPKRSHLRRPSSPQPGPSGRGPVLSHSPTPTPTRPNDSFTACAHLTGRAFSEAKGPSQFVKGSPGRV